MFRIWHRMRMRQTWHLPICGLTAASMGSKQSNQKSFHMFGCAACWCRGSQLAINPHFSAIICMLVMCWVCKHYTNIACMIVLSSRWSVFLSVSAAPGVIVIAASYCPGLESFWVNVRAKEMDIACNVGCASTYFLLTTSDLGQCSGCSANASPAEAETANAQPKATANKTGWYPSCSWQQHPVCHCTANSARCVSTGTLYHL